MASSAVARLFVHGPHGPGSMLASTLIHACNNHNFKKKADTHGYRCNGDKNGAASNWAWGMGRAWGMARHTITWLVSGSPLSACSGLPPIKYCPYGSHPQYTGHTSFA
jgi:hypothetical protein